MEESQVRPQDLLDANSVQIHEFRYRSGSNPELHGERPFCGHLDLVLQPTLLTSDWDECGTWRLPLCPRRLEDCLNQLGVTGLPLLDKRLF
jgi:hypothetical protein